MTKVDLHIYIQFNNKPFINPQSLALLRKIIDTGSLNTAAKELDISYQNAWKMIDNMNKTAPKPIVMKQRGGTGGGGAVLSDYGLLLMKEYAYIELQVLKFTQQLNNEINL